MLNYELWDPFSSSFPFPSPHTLSFFSLRVLSFSSSPGLDPFHSAKWSGECCRIFQRIICILICTRVEARRTKIREQVWDYSSPSPPVKRSEERCKFHQQGPERKPGRKRIFGHQKSPENACSGYNGGDTQSRNSHKKLAQVSCASFLHQIFVQVHARSCTRNRVRRSSFLYKFLDCVSPP